MRLPFLLGGGSSGGTTISDVINYLNPNYYNKTQMDATTSALAATDVALANSISVDARASALQKWSAALGKLRGGTVSNVKVLFVGDSVMAGAYSGTGTYTNAKVKSWPTQFASLLTDAGILAQESSFLSTNTGGYYAGYDPRLSPGGGWTGAFESLGGNIWYNNSTTAALAFTPTQAFDRIEIIYPSYPGNGSMTVDVDGGATLATIDLNAAASVVIQTVNCTLGTHTVNLKRVAGDVLVYGVICYNSTAPKVSIVNAGLDGVTALRVSSPGAGGPIHGPPGVLSSLGQALTVISIGINDLQVGTSASTFQGYLDTIVAAAQTSGSVILQSPIPYNHGNYGSFGVPYNEAMRTVAKNRNCLFVDTVARWGTYANANGLGMMHDNLHPSVGGLAAQAVATSRVVLSY